MKNFGDRELIEAISKSGIIKNRDSNKIYTAEFGNGKGRYITVYIDDRSDEKEDRKVTVSPKIELRLTFIFDKEDINGIEICRYKKDGEIYKQDGNIKLSSVNLEQILGMLELFAQLDLKAISTGSLILDETIVKDPEALGRQLKTLIADEEGRKILATIISSDEKLRDEDLRNIANKKSQLKVFEKFLSDRDFFEEIKQKKKLLRDEDLWQRFFENNKWIFGYGLDLVFTNAIGSKLQETAVGPSFTQGAGKRPDALSKTLGAISNLLFGEIKLPETILMKKDKNHPEVYYPSEELANAVAQVQKTIHKTISTVTGVRVSGKDEKGFDDPSKDVFLIDPKGVVIIGSLKQFKDEEGSINEDMYAGFQLYRRSVSNPQILTYDELLARVQNIIENVEQQDKK